MRYLRTKTLACVFIASFILLYPALAFCSGVQDSAIELGQYGECRVSLEMHDAEAVLRLRVQGITSYECSLDKPQTLDALNRAFARAKERNAAIRYRSISMGRALSYAWMSGYLVREALADRYWNRSKAMRRGKLINGYVAGLLSTDEFLAWIQGAISDSDYRVSRASVEKVLVGKYTDVPGYKGPVFKGRVPFDAQVWFSLEPLR